MVSPKLAERLPQMVSVYQRRFQVIKEVDHHLYLKEWNKARKEAKGHSVKVWIDDTLIWSDSELLKSLPMGTVGLRYSEDEHALFRCIKGVKR